MRSQEQKLSSSKLEELKFCPLSSPGLEVVVVVVVFLVVDGGEELDSVVGTDRVESSLALEGS